VNLCVRVWAMAIAAAAVIVPLGLLFFLSGLFVNLIQVPLSSSPFLIFHYRFSDSKFRLFFA
jgi:hypothetical protein